MADTAELLRFRLETLSRGVDQFIEQSAGELRAAAELLARTARAGQTVFVCGNGGSAAHAMHLEAELLGRYRSDREPLPSFYLGSSTSTSTAVTNDYGVEEAFARPLRALAKSGDLLIALSTSGTSPNVLAALETAREAGLATILITGAAPDADADVVLRYPGESADAIQDGHQLLIHALMDELEGSDA